MSTTLSCGQCGAPLRAEQDWCLLCYATVEPAFDPLTAPLNEVVGRAEQLERPDSEAAVEVDPIDVIAGTRADRVSTPPPETRPAARVQTTDEEPAIEVSELDVMFSMLAAEHRQSDSAAGIAERLEDRSTRIAVMVGGTVIIGAVVFLVLTVLGAIV